MTRREQALWLALAVGPHRSAHALRDLSGADPDLLLETAWPTRAEIAGWHPAPDRPGELLDRMDRLLRGLARRGARALLATDPDYPPPLLARLPSPPAVLFVQGRIPARPVVAVVGSRAAGPRGVGLATDLGRELGMAGYLVLSGGALGIDAAAHAGALEAGAPTVAVLGSGLDRLYPERNRQLFEAASQAGALVTPHLPHEPPRARNFPSRNRLIAAWGVALVVVEAQRRSGALLTASYAKSCGIPVHAAPGTPGTAALLRSGAGLVTGAKDVVGVISGARPAVSSHPIMDVLEQEVLALLAGGPLTVDEVASAARIRPGAAAAVLVRLQLAAFVVCAPGGRYART